MVCKPACRNAANALSVLTGILPSVPPVPSEGARVDVHALEVGVRPLAVFVGGGTFQCKTVSRHLSVFTQPPAHDTSSFGHVSVAQMSISVADERMSPAKCVRPARM